MLLKRTFVLKQAQITNNIQQTKQAKKITRFWTMCIRDAYSWRPNTNEHLQELGTRDCDEWNVGFAGRGFRQQSLPRTWRTSQYSSLGNLGTKVLVLSWVLQKVDKLHYFHFCLFTPGHISASQKRMNKYMKLKLDRSAGPICFTYGVTYSNYICTVSVKRTFWQRTWKILAKL